MVNRSAWAALPLRRRLRVVLRTIAKPDGNDFSVMDLPFNWDAKSDIRKLRIGYFASGFRDSNRVPEWRANEQAVLRQLEQLGVVPEPFDLPPLPTNLFLAVGLAEIGASFSTAVRTGRPVTMTAPQRINTFKAARLQPAFDYLQAQRARRDSAKVCAGTVAI